METRHFRLAAAVAAALPAGAAHGTNPAAMPVAAAPAAPVAFGGFELREAVIPRGQLTIHAWRDGMRLTLTFREESRSISLTDDGFVLALHAEGPNCAGAMRHLAYRGRIGEPGLFAEMLRFAADLPDGCLFEGERQRAFLARLRAARPGFAQGVQHMKARADGLLGGWRRRCPPPPVREGEIIVPSPHDPCA